MRILLSAPILLVALQSPLPAQNPPPKSDIPPECQVVLDDIRKDPPERRDFDIADALKLKQGAACFARLFVQRSSVTRAGFSSFLKKLGKAPAAA